MERNVSKSKKIIEENVFSAWQAGSLSVGMASERLQRANSPEFATSDTRFYIPSIDEYMNPFGEGDLITIIGRPANGKTLLAMYLLDQKIQELQRYKRSHEVVILVTLEVSVERSALYQMARMSGIGMRDILKGDINAGDLEQLQIAALQFGSMPLFIVGHSTRRNADKRRSRPALSPDNIGKAINYIMNEYVIEGKNLDPKLIVVDYLQRIHQPPGKEKSRPIHMMETVDWAKNMALWAGCPVVLNVQAGRAVDERDIKIPRMSDGEWTSNCEQSSDASFGVWMPKTAGLARVPAFANLKKPIKVTDNLMLVGCLKQKDGPAGNVFPLLVDPSHLMLKEMEL